MLPLQNIVSLRAELHEHHLLVILGEMVHLEELSVRLMRRDMDWRDWRPPPLVRGLGILLAQRAPLVCPALHSLTIEWPRNVAKSLRLGVVEIVNLLGRRAQWGHPIRRLVVQAISVQFGDLPPPHFAEELAELKDFVEEYEECIDPDRHVCPFEMQEMWNVEGAEEYWAVDEKQKPRYSGLWN